MGPLAEAAGACDRGVRSVKPLFALLLTVPHRWGRACRTSLLMACGGRKTTRARQSFFQVGSCCQSIGVLASVCVGSVVFAPACDSAGRWTPFRTLTLAHLKQTWGAMLWGLFKACISGSGKRGVGRWSAWTSVRAVFLEVIRTDKTGRSERGSPVTWLQSRAGKGSEKPQLIHACGRLVTNEMNQCY